MSTTALKALTATTGNRTDCWNTPVEFVGDVIKFFGGPVDLDPCSNDSDNRNVPAKNVYTEETKKKHSKKTGGALKNSILEIRLTLFKS